MQEEYAGSIKIIPDSAIVVPEDPEPHSGVLDDGDNEDAKGDDKPKELEVKIVKFDPNSAKISLVESQITALI